MQDESIRQRRRLMYSSAHGRGLIQGQIHSEFWNWRHHGGFLQTRHQQKFHPDQQNEAAAMNRLNHAVQRIPIRNRDSLHRMVKPVHCSCFVLLVRMEFLLVSSLEKATMMSPIPEL